MPIYEFVCNDCKKCFDKLCAIKDDLTLIECEFCAGKNVKKKMSAFATSRDERDGGSLGSSCSSCSSKACSTCGH